MAKSRKTVVTITCDFCGVDIDTSRSQWYELKSYSYDIDDGCVTACGNTIDLCSKDCVSSYRLFDK